MRRKLRQVRVPGDQRREVVAYAHAQLVGSGARCVCEWNKGSRSKELALTLRTAPSM